MIEQQYPLDIILFYIIYGGTTMLTFVVSLYLLLRPVSFFNKDITPLLRTVQRIIISCAKQLS